MTASTGEGFRPGTSSTPGASGTPNTSNAPNTSAATGTSATSAAATTAATNATTAATATHEPVRRRTVARSSPRHEIRALLRAHLAAATGYRHLTRHCAVCARLLRLAMEPVTAPVAGGATEDPAGPPGAPAGPQKGAPRAVGRPRGKDLPPPRADAPSPGASEPVRGPLRDGRPNARRAEDESPPAT
ncbi:DUF6274 family protein [Streptomyces sp. NPDC048462]|uniref:DUF6274 family protein n=1 Tax=Streptomyces sp. NPDC048462 TaxID=3365555 RepID=UPI003712B911